MKLDLDYLNFISKEEMRVLVAIELGMRNHEWVPVHLIEKVSRMKRSNAFKIIKELLKNKLISHNSKKYDGYKLIYKGYDYLALHVFLRRGSLSEVTMKIGVGKESDIYICKDKDGNPLILKLARLGRRSFKTIKKNRDYLGGRTQFNWLYLSRLASTKEYVFMKALHECGFPTPKPVDANRHAILMSYLDAHTMCKVTSLEHTEKVYHECMDMIVKFAEHGLIHSDFNEFNLMIDDDHNLFVIDFPQMVSTDHVDAEFYFNRDLECIRTIFRRRYGYESDRDHKLEDIEVKRHVDQEVQASGFYKWAKVKRKEMRQLEQVMDQKKKEEIEREEENEDSEEEEDYSEGNGEEEQEEEDGQEEVEEDDQEEEANHDLPDEADAQEEMVEEIVENEEKEPEQEEIEIPGTEKIASKEENLGLEAGDTDPEQQAAPAQVQEQVPEGDYKEIESAQETKATEEMTENSGPAPLTAAQREEKERRFIQKALRRKFKKKKKFKVNKNKPKQKEEMRRDIMFF